MYIQFKKNNLKRFILDNSLKKILTFFSNSLQNTIIKAFENQNH